MYHASLREVGMCGTFILYLVAEQFADMSFNLRLSAIQAFAKISDDHRNEKIRGNAYEGALMYTKYV